jgi:predicted Zn-dependent protease
MGLALLRIPALPEEVTEQRTLIEEAGAIAAQLAQRHYDQAFSMLDVMLLKYPNTPFLHYAYGASLANISEFDRAQLQLREEIRINPESALPYIRFASVLLAVQQPAAAAEYAERAVRLAPNSPESHYVLGRVMLEQDETAGAIQELELARQLAPGSPAIHFNLARAFTKAHREAEARRERAEFDRLNRLMIEQASSQRAGEELSQATPRVSDSTPTP